MIQYSDYNTLYGSLYEIEDSQYYELIEYTDYSVPANYFNLDFEVMSSLISTSWFDNDFPLAIKAKTPNKEILIKAGDPIATIIPISLTELDNTSIKIYDYEDPEHIRQNKHKSYGIAAQEVNKSGNWTDWYRDAINEKGESLGSHETKVLRLSVEDNRKMV